MLSGAGFVVAVWGLVLIGNGIVLGLRSGDDSEAGPVDDGFDTAGVVALVLALLIPPLGILTAAYAPVQHRGGAGMRAAAIVLGAILTVIYTFLAVLGASFLRT